MILRFTLQFFILIYFSSEIVFAQETQLPGIEFTLPSKTHKGKLHTLKVPDWAKRVTFSVTVLEAFFEAEDNKRPSVHFALSNEKECHGIRYFCDLIDKDPNHQIVRMVFTPAPKFDDVAPGIRLGDTVQVEVSWDQGVVHTKIGNFSEEQKLFFEPERFSVSSYSTVNTFSNFKFLP